MELFFARSKKLKVLSVLEANQHNGFAVSLLTVSIFMYFVEIAKGSKQDALSLVQSYELLNVEKTDFEWARGNDYGDFEDALQVAIALRLSLSCSKYWATCFFVLVAASVLPSS